MQCHFSRAAVLIDRFTLCCGRLTRTALSKIMAALPDNLKQYTEIALVAYDQGEALIQNLLDLCRLESGEALAIPEPLDLKEHFRKIIDSFQVCAGDHQQVLIID